MKIKTVFLFFLIGTIFTPLSEATDYKITVGDKLRISVWGNPNLDDQVTVRPDGKISFDLIGEVKAEGLKPLELKKIITVKLAEFIKDPEVTVKLIGADMFRIYVMGPLPGVGEKSIRGATSLMQFLSTMMPIPGEIDLKKSYLIRDNKRLDLDFYELLINDNLEYNIPLQSNDTIVFKEKEKTVIEKEEEQEDPFKTDIRIVGAVRREGRIKYRKQMTLLDAILGVGGFTEFANPSETVISRKSEDKIEQIVIDMEAVQAGEIDKDVELKPGDIISVPESIW